MSEKKGLKILQKCGGRSKEREIETRRKTGLTEQMTRDKEPGAACEEKSEAGGGPWKRGGTSALERELRMKIRSGWKYRTGI